MDKGIVHLPSLYDVNETFVILSVGEGSNHPAYRQIDSSAKPQNDMDGGYGGQIWGAFTMSTRPLSSIAYHINNKHPQNCCFEGVFHAIC